MKQLIYRSRPFGFDEPMLAGILVQARRNNLTKGITGALVCRHDLYVQLIEGENTAIEQVYARIAEDDRHCDVKLMHSDQVGERMFPEWEMLDDTMPSMTWSASEIADGSIETAAPQDLRRVFQKIADNARA